MADSLNKWLVPIGVAGAVAGVGALLLRRMRARVIDANTGKEVQPGETFTNVNGEVTVHQVDVGLLEGRALVSVKGDPRPTITAQYGGRITLPGKPDPGPQPGEPEVGELVEMPNPNHHSFERRWVPLVVRYLHPSFPLQKVAFIPS